MNVQKYEKDCEVLFELFFCSGFDERLCYGIQNKPPFDGNDKGSGDP
jgi:hypothetical protein